MKKHLLFIVLVLAAFGVQAQKWGSELGLSYVNVDPVGDMGQIIQRGHGIGLNYALVTPNRRFSFGVDAAYAQYGRDKTMQEYTFDDGSVAPMEVIVSNYFMSFMGTTRLYLTTKGAIRPYLFGKVGYTQFNTELNIYDPDEDDHCEPIEHEVLYKDGTAIGVVGAGVKFDVAKVIHSMSQGRFYIDCSINYTEGGKVRYMNADAPQPHTGPFDGSHVMASFLNTNTQIVHKHHVGNLYESRVKMTELRFGFTFNFLR